MRGDGLAGLRRLDQRAGDRAVAAGAVERLLDGDHVRVARRLAQELHHHVEAFVGVVDDDVLGADRREAVAAEIEDALGEARRVGREQQVRPVVHDELRQVGHAEQPVHHEDAGALGVQLLGDEVAPCRPASSR